MLDQLVQELNFIHQGRWIVTGPNTVVDTAYDNEYTVNGQSIHDLRKDLESQID